MEFALGYAAHPEVWKDLVIAEDLGFTHAWIYDSQMIYSDVYVALGLAAEHTKRIKLGTGVAIPSNRIEPVTAHSIATINQMAPGRAILGIGTGFTGRNTMGLPPVSLSRLREYITTVRKLLRGEEVLFRDGKHERWIRFLHPDHGYINLKDQIPIYLAANGEKALRMVGELADGWITVIGSPDTIQKNFSRVREGAKTSGRQLTNFPTAVLSAGCVLRKGESVDSPRVKERLGPWAILILHALWEQSAVVGPPPGPLAELYQRYEREYLGRIDIPPDRRYLKVHEGHMVFTKPGEEHYLEEPLLRASSLVGTRDEIIERLKGLEAAGVTQVILHVANNGRDFIEEWSREIISNYH